MKYKEVVDLAKEYIDNATEFTRGPSRDDRASGYQQGVKSARTFNIY